MLEIYNKLFETYLGICKRKYNSEKPYENLEECCSACDRLKWELSGMLTLLERSGEITSEKRDEEFQRILNTFSTHDLFGAYMEHGEVMVYTK